jgi:hypothetical protein
MKSRANVDAGRAFMRSWMMGSPAAFLSLCLVMITSWG